MSTAEAALSHDRLLTLPNALTLSRIPLAGALWIDPGSKFVLLAITVAAAVTDILDGRIARAERRRAARRGECSNRVAAQGGIGSWLDPLCDKTFLVSMLAAVYVTERPPLWMLVAIGAREIIVVPLAAAYRLWPAVRKRLHFDFRASSAGKLGTVTQFAAVGAILLASPTAPALALAAGVVGVVAALTYLRSAARLARERR